jgi:EamA domain-containing membrane protein RarD
MPGSASIALETAILLPLANAYLVSSAVAKARYLLVYREPFTPAQFVGFAMVWSTCGASRDFWCTAEDL